MNSVHPMMVGRDWQLARRARLSALLLLFLIPVAAVIPASASPVIIGSKKFTESYVLGEIARRALNDAELQRNIAREWAGTIILWQALQGGQIDAYPEYTGTIAQEILKNGQQLSFHEIRDALGERGVGMTEPLGFDNTYALVMRRSEAQRLGIRTIRICESIQNSRSGSPMNFSTAGWLATVARALRASSTERYRD
jgi:osmoprotectant transport system permease protein